MSMNEMTDVEPADVDDRIVVSETFKLTPVAAIATGQPSFEQWESTFRWCRSVERASSSAWWIGEIAALIEAMDGRTPRKEIAHAV
jgi:hypothetical protein